MITDVISTASIYVTFMVKDPDLNVMEGETDFEMQKWRLHNGLEGSSGKKKKVHLGLDLCGKLSVLPLVQASNSSHFNGQFYGC